jgi:hypothetical protein
MHGESFIPFISDCLFLVLLIGYNSHCFDDEYVEAEALATMNKTSEFKAKL